MSYESFDQLFQDLPADKNSPLFCITKKSALVPLTDSIARSFFFIYLPHFDFSYVSEICYDLGFRQGSSFARYNAAWYLVVPCRMAIYTLSPFCVFPGLSHLSATSFSVAWGLADIYALFLSSYSIFTYSFH